MKSIKKHLDLKKVTKSNNNARSEIFAISLHKKKSIEKKRIQLVNDTQSIAKQLVHSLSAAAKRLDIHSRQNASIVSNPDWPINKKPQLQNLELLKQYLTFISHEAKTQVDKENQSIQITLDEPVDNPTDPAHHAARLGASTIEKMVHNDMLNKQLNDNNNNNNNSTDALPNLVNRPFDRRRPGRPPKPKVFFDEQIIPTISRRKQSRQKKEDIIQCICDTPTDEFGAMVQCDDCLSWLHVDCLDLTKQDLEQSYRCPPCCVSLGSNNQLPKSMAWRYEAQMKSQRLAAINEISDDDDDDDDDDMDDDTNAMECDVVEQPLHVDNLKLPEPIRIDTNYCKDIRSRSTTPEDWPDVSSESHYSISSANTSEVSTPSEHTLCDPFEYQQIMSQSNLIIDIENFELLSRLAYLQKLKDDLFSPNATDVFLCEDNNSKHFISQPDISSQSTVHHESLPSTICSQELSEFSFDNGPFWQPLN